MQVMNDYKGRPSVLKTMRRLVEEDGWQGFYRGFGPRFLNMSLWGTSMIVTYELISESPISFVAFVFLFLTVNSILFSSSERLSVKRD